MRIRDIMPQATIPCKIELYVLLMFFLPNSLDMMELVPMPTASPKHIISESRGAVTPTAKNASGLNWDTQNISTRE